MKLSDIRALAPAIYDSGKCLYLKSGPGRGKTTTVIDCVGVIAGATKRDMGIVVINAPLLTPADTIGYLTVHNAGDGRTEARYTEPFWFRTEEGKRLEEYEGGIVFVDEADKADLDVKKILGEMALSGRCGPHKLPPGWVVWMAGNRSGDRSGSTKELDHLINRRVEIEVTDDLPGWVNWALQNDVHYSIISFAEQNPQIVFPEAVPERQGPFCTPRSLVAAGDMLQKMAGKDGELPTTPLAVELAAGGIGQAAAAALMATLKLDVELPKIETIIESPTTARLPSTPDAQMLVAYKLAMLCDEKTLAPFITYVERLTADFSITFAKSLSARRPMLLASKPMLDWMKRNSAIMSIIAMLK